jgi:phosphatidate cytidylyltransferase
MPAGLSMTPVGAKPAEAGPAKRRRWTDLRKRILSAALLAPLAVTCIWLGAEAWMGMVALAAGGLAIEWVHLCGRRAATPPGLLVPLSVIAAGTAAVGTLDRAAIPILALGAVAAWLWAMRATFASAKASARALGKGGAPGRRAPVSLAAGVPYVGLATLALIWLRDDPAAGRANVLFLILVVWASDIGAYAFGRMLGGKLLAPSISPAKTWAGAVGGLAFSALVGLLAASWLAGAPPTWRAAGTACLISVVAQAGDLLESLIKRRFGVKDSGRLIPGHGGLLDRLDGVLAAAPVAALLAFALGRGVVLWG